MKNKIITSLIILIFILMIATSVNAAVESKANTTPHTLTLNNAYQICYDMRNPTSSLGNNTLDPHLMLNKDYGAFAYLGMSAYGNNSSKATVTGGWSTTPNITGVINVNKESELTSGSESLGGNKYVEKLTTLDVNTTRGMALIETKGWHYAKDGGNSLTSTQVIVRWPYRMRSTSSYTGETYGYTVSNTSSSIKYRPVIWN